MIQSQGSSLLLGECPNWVIAPTCPFLEACGPMYLGFMLIKGSHQVIEKEILHGSLRIHSRPNLYDCPSA